MRFGRFLQFLWFVLRPFPEGGDWLGIVQAVAAGLGIPLVALGASYTDFISPIAAIALWALTLMTWAAYRLYCQTQPGIELQPEETLYEYDPLAIIVVRNPSTTRLKDVQAVIKSGEVITGADSYSMDEFEHTDLNCKWRGITGPRRDIDSSAVLEIGYAVRNNQLAQICTATGTVSVMTGKDVLLEIEVSAANAARTVQTFRLQFNGSSSPSVSITAL
jgi:hypothetical protein